MIICQKIEKNILIYSNKFMNNILYNIEKKKPNNTFLKCY